MTFDADKNQPSRALRVGAVLAVGAASFASPIAVLCCAALALIVRSAVKHTSGFERRVLLGLFAAAILIRVAMIAALFAQASANADSRIISFGFDGDGAFMKLRALWQRNVWLDLAFISPRRESAVYGAYGQTSYVDAIAVLQYLFGPAPYAIHLVNVCCHLAATVLLHRLVKASYGAMAALILAAMMLFMPSMVMWSASALKDSSYLLVFVVAAAAVAWAARTRQWYRRGAYLALFMAAIIAAESIRRGAGTITVAGAAFGGLAYFISRRPWLLLGAAAAAVVVVGSGAAEAFLPRALPTLIDAARTHVGNVNTPGHQYRLLDWWFYGETPIAALSADEAARFVARAVVSFFAVPLPYDIKSATELLLVPQQMLWYAIVVFAAVGLPSAWRRDAFVTWLLVGLIMAAALVVGLYNGNVGTLVRIRDSVVPLFMCLASIGVSRVFERFYASTHTHAAAAPKLYGSLAKGNESL